MQLNKLKMVSAQSVQRLRYEHDDCGSIPGRS